MLIVDGVLETGNTIISINRKEMLMGNTKKDKPKPKPKPKPKGK